jgi:rhamnosyltransferase
MKLSKKYLIIAHYHSSGLIRDDIVNLIKNFRNNFDKILFISTKLKISEKKKIQKYSKILIRQNTGYDFYSYKIGIEYLLKKKMYDNNILLMASSLFYLKPQKLLNEINKIKKSNNTVYTLSKSWEIKEHLQSDIFYFSMNLFKNKLFLNWWKKIKKNIKTRQAIIENYELNFLEKIQEFNIEGKTIFDDNINDYPNNFIKKLFKKLKNIFFKEIKIYKKNPTHFYWEKIYKKYGLIKIDLIKKNPHNVNLNNLKNYFNKKDLNKLKREALRN